MKFEDDPIGLAIWDYATNGPSENIVVESDICDNDIIPVPYLFRDLNEMPELEQIALRKVKGHTLDIGAGAGCHSKELIKRGIQVTAIDTSLGAVDYCISEGLNAKQKDILDLKGEKFDTLLILMNGLGLAETLEKMPAFLKHLKSLLNPNGKIICDSADIKYIFEDEEGGMWIDLNAKYYGEMKFKMSYKNIESNWFSWIYIDQEKLKEICSEVGLSCEIIFEGNNNNYLTELKHL